MCVPAYNRPTGIGRTRTLTVARMTPTEPQTAFAGVMLSISFVIFKTSIATFSEEKTLSWRSGRWGFGAIVLTRRSCERRETSGHFVMRPFDDQIKGITFIPLLDTADWAEGAEPT